MSLDFKLDTSQFNKEVARLGSVTKGGASKILKQESRLLVRDAAKLTPPTGNAPINETWSAQKKSGEAAIEADITNTFEPLMALDIGRHANAKGGRELHKAVRDRNWRKVEELLYRLGIVKDSAVRVFSEFPKDFYESLRGKTSRRLRNFKKLKPYFVANESSLKAAVRERKANSGFAKSGWKKAAAALGLPLPGWITRHSGAGLFKDETGQKSVQSITVGNLVPYIQRAGAEGRIMQRAIDNRVRSMRVRFENYLKNIR